MTAVEDPRDAPIEASEALKEAIRYDCLLYSYNYNPTNLRPTVPEDKLLWSAKQNKFDNRFDAVAIVFYPEAGDRITNKFLAVNIDAAESTKRNRGEFLCAFRKGAIVVR
jgi:hypothetical protein